MLFILDMSVLVNNNNIMKTEKYVAPEIGVVEFANEGVICSSIDVSNPFSGSTEEEL